MHLTHGARTPRRDRQKAVSRQLRCGAAARGLECELHFLVSLAATLTIAFSDRSSCAGALALDRVVPDVTVAKPDKRGVQRRLRWESQARPQDYVENQSLGVRQKW